VNISVCVRNIHCSTPRDSIRMSYFLNYMDIAPPPNVWMLHQVHHLVSASYSFPFAMCVAFTGLKAPLIRPRLYRQNARDTRTVNAHRYRTVTRSFDERVCRFEASLMRASEFGFMFSRWQRDEEVVPIPGATVHWTVSISDASHWDLICSARMSHLYPTNYINIVQFCLCKNWINSSKCLTKM
jgi:hypothetical protein